MKSHKRLNLEVWCCIYIDAVHKCVAEVSQRDLNYVRSRIEKEGLSFLTITLPSFASDFEKSLEHGGIDPMDFRSFRKNKSIPAFLQGMIGRLFDIETGRILYDNPPHRFSILVESIRQICLAFKKIEVPCTPERVRKAMDGFVEIEQSFSEFHVSEEMLQMFKSVSSVLWDNMLATVCLHSLVPRHGPGATADKRVGNNKYQWLEWNNRLEPYFPFLDNCYSSSIYEKRFQRKELESIRLLETEEERPVKVTPVPKTLKAPRIIAIEPCCQQYVQQGLRNFLYEVIQSYRFTRGHINFSDQSINRSLAMISSSDGRLATIDLSDASDRVPLDLAMVMFESNRDVSDAILACRSIAAELPDGRVVKPLRKFASMGSALCFPVEAMYFCTVCAVALLKEADLPVSPRSLKKVMGDIYVYGDDILVPADKATTVLSYLEKYNCKVNVRKTFYRGFFRESCGMDAYGGYSVTPTYIRQTAPENRQQTHNLLSWISTARQFATRGYYRTSHLMFDQVESILGPLPESRDDSFVLGRNLFRSTPSLLKRRYNRDLQRLEVRCWVPSPVFRTDRLEGFGALQKCLLKMEGYLPDRFQDVLGLGSPAIDAYLNSIVASDPKHLERSALYGAVAIKRRWVPVTLTGIDGI